MLHHPAIFKAAWAAYCKAFGIFSRFNRNRFREALRLAWTAARQAVAAAKAKADAEARAALPATIVLPSRVMTSLETALDAVKYLPAHMSAARAQARVRAAYA